MLTPLGRWRSCPGQEQQDARGSSQPVNPARPFRHPSTVCVSFDEVTTGSSASAGPCSSWRMLRPARGVMKPSRPLPRAGRVQRAVVTAMRVSVSWYLDMLFGKPDGGPTLQACGRARPFTAGEKARLARQRELG